MTGPTRSEGGDRIQASDIPSDRGWCGFQCQGKPLAVAVERVVGVLRQNELIPLPLAPPGLLGLTIHHRQVIPVVTLTPHGGNPQTRTVLVIQTEQGTTGLAVDAEVPVWVEAGPSGKAAAGIDLGGVHHEVLDVEALGARLRSELERAYRNGETGGRDDAW